jgi:pyridoxal phosphate enzyme (YggS family)
MTIKTRLKTLKSELPQHVSLVAVSKTKPVSDLLQAYEAGQRLFGENKIQEMVEKYDQLPKDIKWHMIGHVQSNKVKYMASFVDLVHGVDSLKLLKELNKQAAKHQRVIRCLLQLKIATEAHKFGVNLNTARELLEYVDDQNLNHVKICGLMGMASFTNNQQQIETEFKELKFNFDALKKEYSHLEIISMGMSGDYQLAIDCGSTMIRVGSHVFGARNYTQ